jgi:hypothetical protein
MCRFCEFSVSANATYQDLSRLLLWGMNSNQKPLNYMSKTLKAALYMCAKCFLSFHLPSCWKKTLHAWDQIPRLKLTPDQSANRKVEAIIWGERAAYRELPLPAGSLDR